MGSLDPFAHTRDRPRTRMPCDPCKRVEEGGGHNLLFHVGRVATRGRWEKSLGGTLSLFVAAGAPSSVSLLRLPTEPPFHEAETRAASGSPSRPGPDKSLSLSREDRETDACALVWVGLP